MKCSICGKEKASVCERPITMGGPGKAETQPICHECHSERHSDKKEADSQ